MRLAQKAPFLKSAMAGNMNSATSGVSENGWKISDALRATMTDGEQRIKDEQRKLYDFRKLDNGRIKKRYQ